MLLSCVGRVSFVLTRPTAGISWKLTTRLIGPFAGFGMEAVFLLGVGYTRDTTTAIACLTIAVGVSGFAISGNFVAKEDLDGLNLVLPRAARRQVQLGENWAFLEKPSALLVHCEVFQVL